MGIYVAHGAVLFARSCRIEESTAIGIAMGGEGTTAHLEDVEVRGTRPAADGSGGRAIIVQEGASLEAANCLVEDNTGTSLFVSREATAQLTNVDVRDTLPLADGTDGRGLQVQEGASLQAADCLVVGSRELGIGVADQGSEVHLSRVEVRDTLRGSNATVAVGLVSEMGARLVASEAVVTATEGPGLVCSTGSTLRCSDCELDHNAFAGALVWTGGYLDLVATTISNTRPDANEGGGWGLYATDSHFASLFPYYPHTRMTVEGTSIDGHPLGAMLVEGAGAYSIRDSTLVGGDGLELEYPDGTSVLQYGDAVVATAGVLAWDGTSGLLLETNEIQQALRAGVLLDASSATLTNNSFSGNAVDLLWQDCAGVDEPAGLDDVPVVEYCPQYNEHVSTVEFDMYFDEIDPLD